MYLSYLYPGIFAFVISVLVGLPMIPFLMRLKAGQTVRDDGPQTHLAKNGTPTMGGFIFLIGFAAACVVGGLISGGMSEVAVIVLGTLGFALIGFIDDYIKVVLKRSLGLRAWQKFSLQILLSVVLLAVMRITIGISGEIMIPFTSYQLNLGAAYYPLMVFAIVGTVNGANFTDGLDGLASSVTAVIGVFFVLAAVSLGSNTFISSSAMVGALAGFLVYNSHKASVFMGDTGSLALGGYVALTAAIMKMPLFIVIVAFVYVAEVCSVILQVGYFKLTHGKRIFKMAPIHHHFELCGFKETKVVAGFTILTALLCALALLAF